MDFDSSRKNLKRWFVEIEEEDSTKQPPKQVLGDEAEDRIKAFAAHNDEAENHIKAFAAHNDEEETYELLNEDNYGIGIEPFNLDRENEEGYFDADDNYFKNVREKDAWLDSIENNPMHMPQSVVNESEDIGNEKEFHEEDIGVLKRRIANVLEPEETVLGALRRLKGNNRKAKMTSEVKYVFDQLTEDAIKLVQHGNYNVYNEEQQVFLKDAEDY